MELSPIADWGGLEHAGALDDGFGPGLPTELADLVARRDGGERFPAADQPLRLSGAALDGVDLSGLDLSGADLSYAELVGCNLRGARLVRADLTGAQLQDLDLSGAELLGVDLTGADLANANLANAALLEATAAEAVFFGARCDGASFNGADLSRTEFRAAELIGASLVDTVLVDADFSDSQMSGADLAGADVAGASFRDADLHGSRLRHVLHYRDSDWIAADITDADFTGAWNVRRHIQDINYIHEFRTQSRKHEFLYQLWWATSDCGRSLLRWTLWSMLIAFSYAALYNLVDIEWGRHDGPLSPVYFSIVTFTTLGFGDVTPTSAFGEILVMSEVILGYLSLGGMMSILSDKMARRAG
ncbi:MAG: pentapeptide repeat-containing protein [Actinomycetota bacterium]